METEKDVYRELQRELDTMPVGFPATKSGVEIRLLKHLFTPEEAEIAVNLSALPESLERIHKRVKKRGISKESLEQILDRLVKKGAIEGGKHLAKGRKGKYYSKAQLAVGIYEAQVNRLSEGFAKDFYDYLLNQGFAEELHTTKTSQMRTIPINKSLKPEHHVGTYDDARQIVMKSDGPFAVIIVYVGRQKTCSESRASLQISARHAWCCTDLQRHSSRAGSAVSSARRRCFRCWIEQRRSVWCSSRRITRSPSSSAAVADAVAGL